MAVPMGRLEDLSKEWRSTTIFKSPGPTLREIKNSYEGQFSELLLNREARPELKELEETIKKIKSAK